MRYIDMTDLLTKKESWGAPPELWKDPTLRRDFKDFFYKKCWYSEAPVAMSDIHIDHFRPKAEVVQYKQYDYNSPLKDTGYYWLKNDATNYRASCAFCNRKTGGGGKQNFFPLKTGSPLLTLNGNEAEKPLLLDPCNEEDVKILSFFGKDVTCASSIAEDAERVEASRIIYNLSHPDITYMRSKVWESVSQTISAYEAGNMTKGECIRQLGIAVSREAPYSACAIACVNSLAPDEIIAELDLTL